MESRDFDRWARLIATACNRRRVLRVLGAGGMALGLGRRARFDTLAAGLGCCKCSGTLRCELDVGSYGECVTVCGPNKQAIFAPNYTCTRGSSLSSVCKPKRRTTGVALLAGAPGLYDLAFVDRAGTATLAGLLPVTAEAFFTAEAAIAAGALDEPAAKGLFADGVQLYVSRWQEADETRAVANHLSQHVTAEAAAAWYDRIAQPPAGAESFDLELSGIDAGVLFRFPFAPETNPGATVTRLVAITLAGEFVTWVDIDGVDAAPDPEVGRDVAQATVDALIDRPEQTASLAPYIALLPEAAACLPEFTAATVNRTGVTTLRGLPARETHDTPCLAPGGAIRYSVWDGAYVPRHGASAGEIALLRDFFQGAERVLDQTYTIGDQSHTVAIARWNASDIFANDGQDFFARRAEVDTTFGIVREVIADEDQDRWSLSVFALKSGEQWVYGAGAVAFAPPYSFSLGILEPGEPLAESSPGAENGRLPRGSGYERIRELIRRDYTRLLDDLDQPASYAVFDDLRLSSLARDDAVSPGFRDFGAAAATLAGSPTFDNWEYAGDYTAFTAEAAIRGRLHDEAVNGRLFDDWGLVQARRDLLVRDRRTLYLSQYQFPDPEKATGGYDELTGPFASAADLVPITIPGGTAATGYRSSFDTANGRFDRFSAFARHDETVVTTVYDIPSTGDDPAGATNPDEAMLALEEAIDRVFAWYDSVGQGDEVDQTAGMTASFMPLVPPLESCSYHYGVVDGEPLARAGVDADRFAAENPGVQNVLFGSYDLASALGQMNVYFGVRSFAGQRASDDYFAQLPALMQDNLSGVTWFPADVDLFALEPDFARTFLAHGGTWNPRPEDRFYGAHLAVQNETIVLDLGAFLPFTGDAAEFATFDPLTDPAFAPLGAGLAELVSSVLKEPATARLGFLPEVRYEVPETWSRPFAGENTVADPSLPRDFATTSLVVGRTSVIADYQSNGGVTYFTSEAAAGAQEYLQGAIKRLEGKGLKQIHVSSFHLPLNSEQPGESPSYGANFYLTQVQLTGNKRAREWYDAFSEELAYPTAEDVSEEFPGQTRSAAYRFEFQSAEGQQIDRVNTIVQVGRYVTTSTHDIYPLLGVERAPASPFVGVVRAYDDDEWGGEVGQQAGELTTWIPLMRGQHSFRHYYGVVDGEPVPRIGVPTERAAAENPGVATALFGNYGLETGQGPLVVYFDIRAFPDGATLDNYFEQLPDLFEKYQGPTWRFVETSQESEFPLIEHSANWTPVEGTNLIGAHFTTRVGTIALGIGAFLPVTSDVPDFGELDPLNHPAYEGLRAGVLSLIGQKVAEWRQGTSGGIDTSGNDHILLRTLDFPEDWQGSE